jgi:hypothetical protein
MFGPVLWLVLSSFKTQSALLEFPPSFLPFAQVEVTVPGQPPEAAAVPRHPARRLGPRTGAGAAIGLIAQMVDPADPAQQFRIAIDKRDRCAAWRLRPRITANRSSALRSCASCPIRSLSP